MIKLLKGHYNPKEVKILTMAFEAGFYWAQNSYGDCKEDCNICDRKKVCTDFKNVLKYLETLQKMCTGFKAKPYRTCTHFVYKPFTICS